MIREHPLPRGPEHPCPNHNNVRASRASAGSPKRLPQWCQTPGDVSNMAGTRCIDRTWLSLKGFLGQKLLLKHKSKPLNEEAKKKGACVRFVQIFWRCMDQTGSSLNFFWHSSRRSSGGGLKTPQNYFLPVRLNPTIFKRDFCTMHETLAGVGKIGCATNREEL